MKKRLVLFLTLLSCTFIPQGYGFFDGDLGIDIYTSIDDGLTKAENRNYQYELTAQGNKKIYEEINRILKSNGLKPCLVNGITINDLNKIVKNDLATMAKSLDDSCKADDGSIPPVLLSQYVSNIKVILGKIKARSDEKTRKTYEIARIWLYSDGDINNSPFDLVYDIREIEKIIFTQNIEYRWVIQNIDKDFDSLMNGVLKDPKHTGTWGNDTGTGTDLTGTGTWVTHKKYTPFIKITSTWSYVCSDTLTNIYTSWFSEETIKELINSTWGTDDKGKDKKNKWGTWAVWDYAYEKFANSDYQKVNDNSLWPCDQFFCIKIEFVIKRYNLLIWGKTVSIESLLKKSNEHLKKFANADLTAKVQSTNNFQPWWLWNMDLASLFHMGVIIQSRVPPILNIEKTTGSSRWEYTCKNMHAEMYKNLGMEYERANDLQQYKWKEEEIKTLLDTAELPFVDSIVKANTLALKKQVIAQRNALISKSIDKRATYEDADIYLKEFVDLEMFWQKLQEYVSTLLWLAKKLNDIPESN